MIDMTTVLIFAGGSSTRMGHDKSTMFGGVERILQECHNTNITRTIILCGPVSRKEMFQGEVWADPEDCDSLAEIISWAIDRIDGDILLLPCDAFNLTEEGVNALLEQGNCLPLDEFGNRQPLFARITRRAHINLDSESLNEMFENFPSFCDSRVASEFNNFNSQSDLKNHRLQSHR